MKKAIAVILCAALTVLAAGCGQTGGGEAATFADQLNNKNVITVGISPDYPPYDDIDVNGNITGFDADMLAELVKYFGNGEYTIQFVAMEFDTIVSAVAAGTVDIGVSGFTYDPERDVLFSNYYLESAQIAVVAADSGITELSQLAGLNVGVQMGTTGADAAEEYFGDTVNIVAQSDAGLLFESLKTGALDAVICDYAVGMNYQNSGAGYAVVEEKLVDELMMIITANSNDLLLAELNKAISQFLASAEYTALCEKWDV